MMEMGIVVAIIIACGEFTKKYVNAKYIPLVTLVLGVVAGMTYLPHANVQEAIMNGVIVALTSNGVFDMSKIVRK